MKKRLVLYFLFLLHVKLYAQAKDAQLWENFYVETNISRNWYAHINHEGRITENVTAINYGYLDGGLTRKLGKAFRLSFDYVFVERAVKQGYWSERHQVYATLTYKKKFKKLVLYDRQMFQLQVKDIYSSDYGKVPEYYLRNKLTLKYKTESKFTPYLAGELYTHLNNFDSNKILSDRIRYFAGCFYTLNPINEFELYYLFENNFNSNNPPKNFVVGIGFSHSFY